MDYQCLADILFRGCGGSLVPVSTVGTHLTNVFLVAVRRSIGVNASVDVYCSSGLSVVRVVGAADSLVEEIDENAVLRVQIPSLDRDAGLAFEVQLSTPCCVSVC